MPKQSSRPESAERLRDHCRSARLTRSSNRAWQPAWVSAHPPAGSSGRPSSTAGPQRTRPGDADRSRESRDLDPSDDVLDAGGIPALFADRARLAAVWTGFGAAALGGFVAVVVALAMWVPDAAATGTSGSTVRGGLLAFLAAQHGGVRIDGVAIGFRPPRTDRLRGVSGPAVGPGAVVFALGRRRRLAPSRRGAGRLADRRVRGDPHRGQLLRRGRTVIGVAGRGRTRLDRGRTWSVSAPSPQSRPRSESSCGRG